MALKGILKNNVTRMLADRANLLISEMRLAIVKIQNENNSDFNTIANDLHNRMFSIVANNEIANELALLFEAYNKVGKDFDSKYLLNVQLFGFGVGITEIASSQVITELLGTVGLVIQSINLQYAYDNAVRATYANKSALDQVAGELEATYDIISASPFIDSESRLAMLETKTAVMRFFSTIELKDLTTYSSPNIPSTVLAYNLYKDSSKSSEIIDLNSISNTGFVGGVQTITEAS
tara:strand:- start:1612 stop:2319 length:708 start_codon:yes stop_codon:yes gene_type:complete